MSLNYTTVLLYLPAFAALLVGRYFTKGAGIPRPRMMNKPMSEPHNHAHNAA